MNVRGVQIVVVKGTAESAGAELTIGEQDGAGQGAALDERRIRAVCAAGLMEAVVRRLETVALPPYGVPQGVSPVISAKILVQEAIRIARAGGTNLRRIYLCCEDEKAFKTFEKTVRGYVRHFLDVLIWGPFVTVDAIIQVPSGIVLVERSNPPLGLRPAGGLCRLRREPGRRREPRGTGRNGAGAARCRAVSHVLGPVSRSAVPDDHHRVQRAGRRGAEGG